MVSPSRVYENLSLIRVYQMLLIYTYSETGVALADLLLNLVSSYPYFLLL
jgi:hypothetical protein